MRVGYLVFCSATIYLLVLRTIGDYWWLLPSLFSSHFSFMLQCALDLKLHHITGLIIQDTNEEGLMAETYEWKKLFFIVTNILMHRITFHRNILVVLLSVNVLKSFFLFITLYTCILIHANYIFSIYLDQ